MLPGGLYIQSHSMLQSHYSAALYFRTINGFIYPRSPVVAHRINTIIPIAPRDPHLLMPIHRRVVGLSYMDSETSHRPQNTFVPGTWVTPTTGLYRTDVGVIMGSEYKAGIDVRPNSECLVAFLPRLAIPEQGNKKRRLFDNAKLNYVSANRAAGFNANAEHGPINKRKLSATRPRIPKIYQASSSFESFAKSHSFPLSKLRCYECSHPLECDHPAKQYEIRGQKVTQQGLALVVHNLVNLRKATSIPSKDLRQWLQISPGVWNTPLPLPSSWYFEYGERVRLSPQYGLGTNIPDLTSEIAVGSEGWITVVQPTGCEVTFINMAEATAHDQVLTATENTVIFIPHRYLLKVFAPGDRVEIRQHTSSPLDGLVVGVDEFVAVKLGFDDNELRKFHPNSLKNISLLPKIYLARSSQLPQNVSTVNLPTPPTTVPPNLTFTGHSPWLDVEVRVIGTEHSSKAPQMHKGEIGRVKDVTTNLSFRSGIAILIHFDAPSTSPDTWFDFDRIRRRDSHKFLAYEIHSRSHLQFKPGYVPQHSSAEVDNPAPGRHPQSMMDQEWGRLAEERAKWKAEEKRKKDDREWLEMQSRRNFGENATFTTGAAPLTLRAGTPPPLTDWLNDVNITNALPRGQIRVALRDQEDDVELTIGINDFGINEGVYFIKPKGQPTQKLIVAATHLHPTRCSHAAFKSHSAKLFLVCFGEHAGKLGRSVHWGIDDTLTLKQVRHIPLESESGQKKKRFKEIFCDVPLLHVSQRYCAHVPMMPDEEKAARDSTILKDIIRALERRDLGAELTDKEKITLGEM